MLATYSFHGLVIKPEGKKGRAPTIREKIIHHSNVKKIVAHHTRDLEATGALDFTIIYKEKSKEYITSTIYLDKDNTRLVGEFVDPSVYA